MATGCAADRRDETRCRCRRRRAQHDFDARAGVQADAGRLDRRFERALLEHRRVQAAGQRVSEHGTTSRGEQARSPESASAQAPAHGLACSPAASASSQASIRLLAQERRDLRRVERRRGRAGATATAARTTAGWSSSLVVDRSRRACRRRRCRCARRPASASTSMLRRRAAAAPRRRPSPVAIIVTRRSLAHRVVDHGADDHHRILRRELLDRVHHLVVLLHLEARRRRDVDQHAARAGQVDVLEQRALHRLLRGRARRDPRRSRSPIPSSPSRLRPSRCARRRSRR